MKEEGEGKDSPGEPSRVHLLTTKTRRPYWDASFRSGDYLVFGCESKGLPESILNGMDDRVFHVPMPGRQVRSLNLANVATAVAYQAMRTQLGG